MMQRDGHISKEQHDDGSRWEQLSNKMQQMNEM